MSLMTSTRAFIRIETFSKCIPLLNEGSTEESFKIRYLPVFVEVERDVRNERTVIVQNISRVGVKNNLFFPSLVDEVDGTYRTVLLDFV